MKKKAVIYGVLAVTLLGWGAKVGKLFMMSNTYNKFVEERWGTVSAPELYEAFRDEKSDIMVVNEFETSQKKYYEPTKIVGDDDLYIGETVIESMGCYGIETSEQIITYYNGLEVERRTVSSSISQTAVPTVIHKGTRERPDYIMPVESYVLSSGFGARWGTMHKGIDLAVPTGTSVYAAASGTVIQSGWNGGYGISVYILHDNGSVTRYGHMSQTLVNENERIEQGELIGLSGSTGDSTGPHVHFEIRINGEPVDPLTFVE